MAIHSPRSRAFIGGLLLVSGMAQTLAQSQPSRPSIPDLFRIPPSLIQEILNSPGTRSGGSLTDPSWKSELLGQMDFNVSRDQRRNYSHRGGRNEFEIFRMNEEGRIHGEELLRLARPAERALFDQVLSARGQGADLERLYQEYLGQTTDQGMALLLLNRILDHESMKRKFQPEVSDDRVAYVMRSILIRNAIDQRKVPTRTITERAPDGTTQTRVVLARGESDLTPYVDLYGWLKELVGENPVRFNIDWRFSEGVRLDREALLSSRDELSWPEITLTFMKLPATYQDFEQELRVQLNRQYQPVRRNATWRTLIQEFHPNLSWESLFAVTTTELRNMYDALKGSMFRVQELMAEVSDLEIAGAKSQEFKARYLALLSERQTALLRDLFGTAPGGARDAASQEQLKAQILGYRARIPREVMEAVLVEFSTEISLGQLQVSINERSLRHDGLAAMPTDSSPESVRRRTVFNPMFASTSLFPKVETIGTDGKVTILFLRSQTPGAVSSLPISDPRVDRVLRAKIQMKVQGKVFRDMAYRLFRENRFVTRFATCNDAAWPCARTSDVVHLTEALFPETLYPGKTLGEMGPGRPATSSLARPEGLSSVMEISTELFQRVFEIPNE